jgi:alkylation response protein AidB-like acyl-CoA dehydrogenase
MEFVFSDEQLMAADSVKSALADLCTGADLRRLMAEGAARDEKRWRALSELGLFGLLLPEEQDGLGLSEIDLVLIAEACGYAALPEPLVEQAGVGVPLLAAFAKDARAGAWLEKALTGEATIAVGHHANALISDADTAGVLLIARDDGLHLVEPSAARLTRHESIDPFRRQFSVEFDAYDATRLATGAEAAPHLALAFERGALFAAAQGLGLAQRSVDLAADYAKERLQFGKAIGSTQAVKHHLATCQTKIVFARPVVYAAAAQLDPADLFARARVSHAKLAALDAADVSARSAIQVHGAMGYSWEVDVHFYLKRALALGGAWGDGVFHRARYAERIYGAPLGPRHTFARQAGGQTT